MDGPSVACAPTDGSPLLIASREFGRLATQSIDEGLQDGSWRVELEAGGALRWTKPANGAVGLAADGDRVYGAESNGRLLAWKLDNGEVQWQSELLLNRGLSAPLVAGRSIAIGDAQGYVHVLAREDGKLLNRLETDGSAIVSAPLLAGQNLLALTRKGVLYAWRPE